MNTFKIRLSLRYKLMLVLSSLPILCLSLYLVMATDLFQKDKVAYVFDSSMTVSRSIATQTRIEIQALLDQLMPICESVDATTRQFTTVGKLLLQKQKRIRALMILRKNPAGGFDTMATYARDPQKDQAFLANAAVIEKLRNEATQQSTYVGQLKEFPNDIGVSFRAGALTDPNYSVVISLYESDDFMSNYEAEGLYKTYLVNKQASIAVGPDDQMILSGLTARLNSPMPEGTAELNGTDHQTYLVSYAATGLGDLMVISYVNKKKALKAVEVLVAKSVMFFIALIASTLIISVIAARKLTSQLSALFEATKKIANGDFNVRIESRSRDEIGGLAQSFTWMAQEVSRLMSETAQKARMENELATVKTVQETLFPPSSCDFGAMEIVGHFEPASECGGDWWSYSKVENRIFLWIGDATGHGAPAALITSAARSAASVIESFPTITPGPALRILNHAIHQTSKGKINMTFFLGCLDLTTGLLTYSCASHDPPYLMKKRSGQALKKKDLIPLMDVNGPRLGERAQTIYEETSVQLEPGDLIFFYTDGIMDIQNEKSEKWGERMFLKTLIESSNGEQGIQEKVSQLRKKAMDYRQGAELIDDVTMFMIEYNPAKEAKAAA